MNAIRKLSLAALVLMLVALAQAQNQQQSSELPVGSATVAAFQGEVTVHAPDGTVLAADRGMVLNAESVIETGKGSMLLNLQDGSQILVKSHSHVVLKAPDQGPGYSLELAIGKVVAKIKKRLSNSPSFKMGTPTAVITVRGTRFEVEVDKKRKTRVEVYEGVVEVTGMGVGTGAVMLRPGYLTNVRLNREPDQPRESTERDRDRELGGGMPGPGGIRDDRPDSNRRTGEQQQPSGRDNPDGEREDN